MEKKQLNVKRSDNSKFLFFFLEFFRNFLGYKIFTQITLSTLNLSYKGGSCVKVTKIILAKYFTENDHQIQLFEMNIFCNFGENRRVAFQKKKNTEGIIPAFSLLQHAYCPNLQKRIKGPVKHLKLYHRCFTRSIDHLYCYLVSFFSLHKLGKLPSSKGRNTCKTLLAVVFSR